MNTIEMKTGGYAIYDASAALKKFLEARASGTASKELMMQLSAEAMLEQEAERSIRSDGELGGVVIQLDRARRKQKEAG
jgi:hypothetical protein